MDTLPAYAGHPNGEIEPDRSPARLREHPVADPNSQCDARRTVGADPTQSYEK